MRPIRNLANGREFSEVLFSDARTAGDLVVGDVNGGWKVVMGTLDNERAGATVRPFQAMFERETQQLIGLVRRRGLDHDPVVRQRVARAWAGLTIMGFNNDRLLVAALQGGDPGSESSIGKLFWANWHRGFGELMVDLMGPHAMVVGHGYRLDSMQHSLLNSGAETIYGGANEIQRNIVGERVLGLPKEQS